jgi:hypothetical protein
MIERKPSRARALVLVCVVAAPGAAAAIVACSDFSGTATDEADAATLAETAPPLDATSDAPADAAPDASKFCAAHADAGLCADFDEGDPVGFHFIETTGTLGVSTLAFVSPPAAMRAVTSTSNAFAKARPMSPAFVQTQRLSFDTYIGAPGQDGGLTSPSRVSSIAQIGPGCAFDVESLGTTARLNVAFPTDAGRAYDSVPMTAYPPAGRWTHVDVLLDGENEVFVTVRINDVVALARRSTKCRGLAADPVVLVGLLGASDGIPANAEAHFDNVLFEAN